MGNLDKRFLITVNLNDSSVDIINESMKFYNTDKNIANFYVRINNNLDGFTKYVPKADATKYKVKVTALKPKTKMFRELLGVPSNDLTDGTCAIYKFELPNEFTDQIGDVYCETTVTSGDEELTADYFKYKVKESVLTNANKEIINSPDLPVLKSLLKEVQKVNYINDYEISDTYTFSNAKINDIERTIDSKLTTMNDNINEQFHSKASKVDLELEKTRIDNLVAHAGNTGGNAELLDIRVGVDGIVYPTAGEAVRSIENKLNSIYEDVMAEENQIWEV